MARQQRKATDALDKLLPALRNAWEVMGAENVFLRVQQLLIVWEQEKIDRKKQRQAWTPAGLKAAQDGIVHLEEETWVPPD